MRISAAEIFNHPDYRIGMNSLRDLRDHIIPSDMTFRHISNQAKNLMNEFDQKLDNCRWATVIGDRQSYAKIHQFIVAGRLSKSPVERKAFRDIAKAKDWLGLPEGYEIRNPSQARN